MSVDNSRQRRDSEPLTHNLPAQLTSFVGREADRQALAQLLRGGTRLVTLTGPGGVGKTRLAIEVGCDVEADFNDGVWLIELAPVTNGRHVPQAVAAVLRLQEEPPREVTDTLAAALRERQSLLVLDNCEHVLAATADLALRLLSQCPRLSLLVTSREPLGLPGGVTRRVRSLERPELTGSDSADRLLQLESVKLFADRAAAACGEFALLEHAGEVAQICHRLDGLPLALELAAARVPALGTRNIAARLDDRFRLLGGTRPASPRHQTLRATLDWSYDLLDQQERAVFEQLAVFSGGWSLEAAEAICADPDASADRSTADLLGRLVDKSLVAADDSFDGTRWFRLLETIRVYALDKLRGSGREAAARGRHLAHFAEVVEASDHLLRRSTSVAWEERRLWLTLLTRNIDNLRGAVDWACTGGNRREGLRLAGALLPFMYTTSYLGEGRQWLARLLVEPGPPTSELAQALATASKLAAHHGDDAAARTYAASFFDLPHAVQGGAASADVHGSLCIVETRRGDLAAAVRHGEQAVSLALANGDPINAAMYRFYVAAAAMQSGDPDQAEELYQRSLADTRAVDFRLGVALAVQGLADLARLRGDTTAARRLHRDALEEFRCIETPMHAAYALIGLGHVALEQRDIASARRDFGEALEIALSLGQWQQLLMVLDGVMRVAESMGHTERASRLRCAIEQMRGDVSVTTQEQAVALARDILRGHGRGQAADATPLLSQRELEVVELLAAGLSNRQIAERLVISVRTADRHVENVLAKLELSSRGQIVAWAMAQPGLLART